MLMTCSAMAASRPPVRGQHPPQAQQRHIELSVMSDPCPNTKNGMGSRFAKPDVTASRPMSCMESPRKTYSSAAAWNGTSRTVSSRSVHMSGRKIGFKRESLERVRAV